jgi:hypothetical protein
MAIITTLITVGADGTISDQAPREIVPGEHQATIMGAPVAARRRSVRDMPMHDLPWDGRISLCRDDMDNGNGQLK